MKNSKVVKKYMNLYYAAQKILMGQRLKVH